MASIFDQYEESARSLPRASSQSAVLGSSVGRGASPAGSNPFATPTPRTIKSRQMPAVPETPIFNKERIEFQIPNGKSVSRMAVCDRLVLLYTKDNTLCRIDLRSNPDQIESMDIRTSSPNDGVEDIFLDPLGRHILLAMRSGEVLYFSRHSKKSRTILKLRTHILTAVGWNYQVLDSPAGPLPILLGTQQGVIFETEFNASAAEASTVFLAASVESYWKQVCNLAQPEPVHIRGIYFDRLKGKSGMYAVLVATNTRLYQFRGTLGSTTDAPLFQEIFMLDPEKPMTNFLELPGNPRHCCLAAWRPVQNSTSPSSFAWLNEPGVYYADIGITGDTPDSYVLVNPQLYTFPKEKDKGNRPLSLVTTEFHVLIQYPTGVRVLSKLSCQIVFDDVFSVERYGKLMGICRDPASGTVWVYSEAAVYRYKITDESRNVWRIYLAKGDYDSALRFCQNDPSVSNMVQILKAESLLQQGQYEQSAEIYATSEAAFEEVVLKFSRLRQEKALKLLLLKKAELFKSNTRSPQLFMVCSWLMEIYLNHLQQLKTTEKDQVAYKELLGEFREFMANPQFTDVFTSSPDVFCSILLSHGADEEYLFLANHLGDSRRLIEFYLERQMYKEAIRVLSTQTSATPAGNAAELIYDFSPQLMRHVPKMMVDLWISKKTLNPHRLLPSLQRYNGTAMDGEAGEVVRFLEYCVFGVGTMDGSLHNYLVGMYCRMRNEEALLQYLLTIDEECKRKNMELYDRKGTLRLCVEHTLPRAAVHLYCVLDLHIQAVELALKFDPDLAKSIAKSFSLDNDTRKRLWLLIAQYMVTQDSDISKATELLHESGDIIKIEDILPFFPDFVTIDDFKEAICASLEDYNRHIGTLKGEVEEATREAEDLRGEISEFRSQCMFINGGEVCTKCRLPLLTQQFYVFPCKHHLHADCLMALVRPNLMGNKPVLVDDLRKQLETMREQDDSASLHSFGSGGAAGTLSKREMVKQELEDLIASECPFCGLLMIKSVDLPFISPDEYDAVTGSWQ
ncbi:vacuolar protein sorting-associated protein 18 homolog [Paramacrobiotus metropolitanus]|uniref:vacuolar protein sorting-associated protein 18 homolog n=1 Tax=Paramacrobiotus metropolitanus TaxID=2943436 RepID=UPI002445D866|nr:vacuolar protein sorting-associated protein 18 homolog [Paramacrobiotus metropolitanus]